MRPSGIRGNPVVGWTFTGLFWLATLVIIAEATMRKPVVIIGLVIFTLALVGIVLLARREI